MCASSRPGLTGAEERLPVFVHVAHTVPYRLSGACWYACWYPLSWRGASYCSPLNLFTYTYNLNTSHVTGTRTV